jgi:hypothetical protein
MGRKFSNFFLYTALTTLIVWEILTTIIDYAKRQLLQKSEGSV